MKLIRSTLPPFLFALLLVSAVALGAEIAMVILHRQMRGATPTP